MVAGASSEETPKIDTAAFYYNASTKVLTVVGDIVANKLVVEYTTITTTLIQTDDVFQANNTSPSTSTTTGALLVAGGVGVGNNVYVGGKVGWVNPSNQSVVYQYYNTATNSLDTIFG